MKLYSITYDLLKPGQDYTDLLNRLRALGAVSIEKSQWILKSAYSAMDLANDLLRYMDGNDRLLVARLQGEAAWKNLAVTDDRVKQLFAA